MSSQRTALLIGSTGLIGGHVVSLLLEDSAYSKVTALVRKSFFPAHPKLTELVVDFDRMEQYKSHFAVDDIFCCLGSTTKDTPDPEQYRKVDVLYPLEAAKLGRQNGAKQYLIVSAIDADINSRFAYLQMKGEVEQEIKKLGYDSLHIFQPSLLAGRQEKKRLKEEFAIWVGNLLKGVYPKRWQKYLPTEGRVVAQAMIAAAKSGKKGMFVYLRPEIVQSIDLPKNKI